MTTTTTTYSELCPGMRVWVHGHLFTAMNTSTDSSGAIRFTGRLPSDDYLAGTGYDGAQYGGFPNQPMTVEIDPDCRHWWRRISRTEHQCKHCLTIR